MMSFESWVENQMTINGKSKFSMKPARPANLGVNPNHPRKSQGFFNAFGFPDYSNTKGKSMVINPNGK